MDDTETEITEELADEFPVPPSEEIEEVAEETKEEEESESVSESEEEQPAEEEKKEEEAQQKPIFHSWAQIHHVVIGPKGMSIVPKEIAQKYPYPKAYPYPYPKKASTEEVLKEYEERIKKLEQKLKEFEEELKKPDKKSEEPKTEEFSKETSFSHALVKIFGGGSQ